MDIFSHLLKDCSASQSVYLVTLVRTPPDYPECIGQQALIYPGGASKGCIADAALTSEILRHLSNAAWERPQLFRLADRPGFEFFWDKLSLHQQAVIFGGGHISQPLAEMLSMIGYSVVVTDDRPDFANQARFPAAQRVLCDSFQNAFSQLDITPATAVVIVTRGHQHDLACLRQVMDSDAFYIGMIGSRRKVFTVFEALRQEGAMPQLLQRVRAPIGLDIHAQTPAEIALSIAAEIVASAKGGTCLPLHSVGRERND
jgi:xanthine dehydrogenase accessory factor